MKVSNAMIRERVSDANPEALTADGFEDALIGMVELFGKPPLALYDYEKCIAILVKRGMSDDEAREYFSFNVLGAYVGESTPAFATIMRKVD